MTEDKRKAKIERLERQYIEILINSEYALQRLMSTAVEIEGISDGYFTFRSIQTDKVGIARAIVAILEVAKP